MPKDQWLELDVCMDFSSAEHQRMFSLENCGGFIMKSKIQTLNFEIRFVGCQYAFRDVEKCRKKVEMLKLCFMNAYKLCKSLKGMFY